MITSKIRGHVIYTENGIDWYYADDKSLYLDNDRACVDCGICVPADQPDPCLGWLDGVAFACCGHGDSTYEYVMSNDRVRYDSVEAWRLDTDRATLSDTTHQQEV